MPRVFGRRAQLAVGAAALVVSTGIVPGAEASAGTLPASHRAAVYGPLSKLALSNWGGYVADGTPGAFTVASAHWRVATVTCNSTSNLYAPWVGIDGDGDTTVEQIGVQTDCSSGIPVSTAWYEFYPAPPVYFSNAVSAGDSISASVTYAAGQITLKIHDRTRNWSHWVSQVLAPQRLSAEAVIEAPGGGSTYPAFQAVNFTHVMFNNLALGTYSPTPLKTGTFSHKLVPTAITNSTNFSIVPKT
jgi:hypothetical protein